MKFKRHQYHGRDVDDGQTFKYLNSNVDLGRLWIYGIDDNGNPCKFPSEEVVFVPKSQKK